MKTKSKWALILLIAFFGVSASHSGTYIEYDDGDSIGSATNFQNFLEANFTSNSLGTISLVNSDASYAYGSGDVVIFLRDIRSADYSGQAADFNNNGANILMMSAQMTRLGNYGWFTADDLNRPADTGAETTIINTNDSIFAGIDFSGGPTLDIWVDGITNPDLDVSGASLYAGTELATINGDTFIARIDQGAAWSAESSSGTHGGDRIVFFGNEDITQSTLPYLTDDGQTILKNSLAELGLVAAIPEPATLGLICAMGGSLLFIRRHMMM